MKKFSLIAFATLAAFGVAACGSSDDASEDAMADTVEMPADEALVGAPDPVPDTTAQEAAQSPEETRTTAEAAAAAAEATVADVEAAAEQATRDAEANMD